MGEQKAWVGLDQSQYSSPDPESLMCSPEGLQCSTDLRPKMISFGERMTVEDARCSASPEGDVACGP